MRSNCSGALDTACNGVLVTGGPFLLWFKGVVGALLVSATGRLRYRLLSVLSVEKVSTVLLRSEELGSLAVSCISISDFAAEEVDSFSILSLSLCSSGDCCLFKSSSNAHFFTRRSISLTISSTSVDEKLL